MAQVRRYDNYTMSERQGNENTRYTNDEYLDRINHAFLEASRLTQEAEDLTVFEYEDQGAKLHRLFDTYWKLSDSIDRLREEVWDADDSFHRDVNQTANELEIIRLEEIRVPDTIGYYPSGGGNPRQLGIKDFMEVGVRETDADIEGFREIFGRTVICGEDEMTLETYIRILESDSEFDIEYYCPEKEWINELLSIGSFGIKNLYDGMAGYDIITGEHLSKREKESRFIWGIIETALSIFLAVAAATGLLGKIGSKLSQKISPLIEKLEPYITKIDDAVGHVQKQICQAVQRAGGVVDDTFRLEPVAGETIETLGKEVVQESGEAAGREILQEGSETVETIQSSLDVKEEVQTVVADEVKTGIETSYGKSREIIQCNTKDAAADELAKRIGGQSRSAFADDPIQREFDVISDQYIAQAKPPLKCVNKTVRTQMKATFEAAKKYERKVYYQFEGIPSQEVLDKLYEYSERYGVEVIIDTEPLGILN